jgi:hypothetical protein
VPDLSFTGTLANSALTTEELGDIAVSPSEEAKTPRGNEQTRKHQRHKHADFQEKAPLRIQPLILAMESLALGPIPAEQLQIVYLSEACH